MYFEGIHPFEDGNGRIGRILMQMSLSRDFKRETPLAISRSIGKNKELYYDHFESGLDITNAIKVMGKVLREAVSETKSIYELTYLRDTIENSGLNARQLKVMDRLVDYELRGKRFEGGLSNSNYRKISGSDEKTAQRDLRELSKRGLLVKTGRLKATRYSLPITSVQFRVKGNYLSR